MEGTIKHQKTHEVYTKSPAWQKYKHSPKKPKPTNSESRDLSSAVLICRNKPPKGQWETTLITRNSRAKCRLCVWFSAPGGEKEVNETKRGWYWFGLALRLSLGWWPQTLDLPASASHILGLTDTYHHSPTHTPKKKKKVIFFLKEILKSCQQTFSWTKK